MPTAADQTLDLLTPNGRVKAITTTDNAVSVFNFPKGVAAINIVITTNGATLLFAQDASIVNGLARPAVNTLGRLDLPANSTWEGTPAFFDSSGVAPFTMGVCTTVDGSNCTVQVQVSK